MPTLSELKKVRAPRSDVHGPRTRSGGNGDVVIRVENLSKRYDIGGGGWGDPREDIGWFNPWLDIAAARHETAESRMFIS